MDLLMKIKVCLVLIHETFDSLDLNLLEFIDLELVPLKEPLPLIYFYF